MLSTAYTEQVPKRSYYLSKLQMAAAGRMWQRDRNLRRAAAMFGMPVNALRNILTRRGYISPRGRVGTSQRSQHIIDYVQKFQEEQGKDPRMAQIARELRLHPDSVRYQVRKLAIAGRIKWGSR
jgi:hypothetical protein